MPLMNADVILQTIASYRLCWISGRFGGGKTSVAYEISRHFLKQGYRLVSNNMSAWADEPANVDFIDGGYHLKSVVLLDEGGLWFKSGQQIEMIASYAAKMDVVYLLPSFWPPTRKAQVVVVQPLWNLKATGLPIILYRWRVREGGFDDKGIFWWWKPQEIYGVYSRQDPGDVGQEIVEWLVTKTEDYRGKFGRSTRGNEISDLGTASEADIFQEAIGELSDVTERFIPVFKRKGRR